MRPLLAQHVRLRTEGRIADDAGRGRLSELTWAFLVSGHGHEHALPRPGPERLPHAGAMVGVGDPVDDLDRDDALVRGEPAFSLYRCDLRRVRRRTSPDHHRPDKASEFSGRGRNPPGHPGWTGHAR